MYSVSQLTAEHRKIQRLFGRLECLPTAQDLTALVQTICDRLAIYLTIKEEVFYPGLSRAHGAMPDLDESIVEHFSLRAIKIGRASCRERVWVWEEGEEVKENHGV